MIAGTSSIDRNRSRRARCQADFASSIKEPRLLSALCSRFQRQERCDHLLGRKRSESLTIFGRGDGLAAYVGIDDVAEAIVRLATMSDPPELVEFGGPETITRNELVTAFEKALGAPLRRRSVPRLLMRLGSVALRPFHPGLASALGMGLSLDLRSEAPDDHALRELGIRARPVSDYIRELVEAERTARSGTRRPS